MGIKDFLLGTPGERAARDQKMTDFKAGLDAQFEKTRVALEAETAEKTVAIEEAGKIEMNKIDAEFIDNQKANILKAHIDAGTSIIQMGTDHREKAQRTLEKYPGRTERIPKVMGNLAYVKGFLVMHSIDKISKRFASMGLELPQQMIDDINEKRGELKKAYFEEVAELKSDGYEFMLKMDESDFD